MYYKKKKHDFFGIILKNKMTKFYLLIILVFILLMSFIYQYIVDYRKNPNVSQEDTKKDNVKVNPTVPDEEFTTDTASDIVETKDRYALKINKSTNVLYVYKVDKTESQELIKAFLCSVSKNISELDGMNISNKYIWKPQNNNLYCQYATTFGDNYSLQSVPYNGVNKDALRIDYYTNLGQNTDDSNVIYLHTGDAYWIYNNVGSDSIVSIYSKENEVLSIQPDKLIDILWLIGWEPTDPDSKNVFYNGHVHHYDGIRNQTIKVGQYFNPLNGVTCIDSEGKTIPDGHILVDGNVDTSTPGDYNITYVIEDIYGGNIVWDSLITVE